MFRTHATLKAGLAALMLGGTILASATSAEAGASTGTWRNGMVAGPYGAGYYGHGYGPARYGYRRSHGNGGAVAAGLIGGLALGALATAPAYSYPAYPAYPAAAPGYYGDTTVYDAPACYTVRRRFVDAWGRPFIRREQVCE
jgi:hypothetical protein